MKRTLFFSACLTAISSIGLVSAVVQNRSIQEQPTLSAVADSTGKLLDPHSLNHPENPLSKN